MAIALGGALLVAVIVFTRHDRAGALTAALAYERLFWAAAGVLVMTGVGNLGAFGRALPEPRTEWGSALTVKLVAVAVLLVISLPRTLAVLRLESSAIGGVAVRDPLRAVYGVTLGLLAVIVFIAEVLAH
jgi:hypothetical protein